MWCRGHGLTRRSHGSKEQLLVPTGQGRRVAFPGYSRAGWGHLVELTHWSEGSRGCAGKNAQSCIFTRALWRATTERRWAHFSQELVKWLCLKEKKKKKRGRKKKKAECWQGIVGQCRQDLNVLNQLTEQHRYSCAQGRKERKTTESNLLIDFNPSWPCYQWGSCCCLPSWGASLNGYLHLHGSLPIVNEAVTRQWGCYRRKMSWLQPTNLALSIYRAIIIQSFKTQWYLLKGTIWVKTKTSQLNDW